MSTIKRVTLKCDGCDREVKPENVSGDWIRIRGVPIKYPEGELATFCLPVDGEYNGLDAKEIDDLDFCGTYCMGEFLKKERFHCRESQRESGEQSDDAESVDDQIVESLVHE